MAIRELWLRILSIGSRDSDDREQRLAIRFSNFLITVMSVVGFAYTPVFLAFELWVFGVLAPLFTLNYMLCYFWNAKGLRQLSYAWGIVNFCISVSLFAVLAGSNSNIQQALYIVIFSCFVLYPNRKQAVGMALLPILSMQLVIYLQERVPPLYSLSSWLIELLRLAMTFTVTAVMVAILEFFRHQLQRLDLGLKDLLKKRESLLSMLSHDINNPLAISMLSSSSLLRGTHGELNPDQHKRVTRIDSQLQAIHGLIKGARSLLALQTGKSLVRSENISLAQLLENAKETLLPLLQNKRIELTITIPPEPGLCVRGDYDLLLLSVFGNIISNAIKFSHVDSKITLVVSVKAELATIDIRDYGIGVPAEILPFLFASDKVTSRPGTANEKGTGFGLPLVYEVLKVHAGKIQALSPVLEEDGSLGPGTLMRIHLPCYYVQIEALLTAAPR